MDVPDMHGSNRAAWDEAAARYAENVERDIEFLRSGGVALLEPETRILGDLEQRCGRAVHLQCAAGKDTLSLLNLGVREVVGMDISGEMIRLARCKSEALRANAGWYACDVLDAPHELDSTADLVYTGKGALVWLHDLGAWARVAARLLRPGGRLYLFEEHPITWTFDREATHIRADPEYDGYFADGAYTSQGWTPQYIGDLDRPKEEQTVKYERQWSLGSVINALIRAGLRIERFEEHPDRFWDDFPNMPDEEADRFPHTYSLLAGKPQL